MTMSELRELVIDAHGGIDRWNKVKAIEGDMSITGAMWARKGCNEAAGSSQESGRHRNSRSGVRGDRYRRHPHLMRKHPISRLARRNE
jgi:hypothetical protein